MHFRIEFSELISRSYHAPFTVCTIFLYLKSKLPQLQPCLLCFCFCQHQTPPSISLVSFHLPHSPSVFVLPSHRQHHSVTSWLNLDLSPFCRWQKPGLAVISISQYLRRHASNKLNPMSPHFCVFFLIQTDKTQKDQAFPLVVHLCKGACYTN